MAARVGAKEHTDREPASEADSGDFDIGISIRILESPSY